jgi:hypothetical protein
MANSIKNTFINSIAEHIENINVSNALFREVDSITSDSLYFSSGLTGSALRSGEKLAAPKAVAYASSLTDTAALHKLASSEKRVTVLREIAGNTAISADTAEIIRLKAHSLSDSDLFTALSRNESEELDAYFHSLFRSEENCNALWSSYMAVDAGNVSPATQTALIRAFRYSPGFSAVELEALQCAPSASVVQFLIQQYVLGLLDARSEANILEMVSTFDTSLTVRNAENFRPLEGHELIDVAALERLIKLEDIVRQKGNTLLGPSASMPRRYGGYRYGTSAFYALASKLTISSEALRVGVAYVADRSQKSGTFVSEMLQFLTATSFEDSDDQILLLETLVDYASELVANDSVRIVARFAHQHQGNIYDLPGVIRKLTADVDSGNVPKDFLDSFLDVFGRGGFHHRELGLFSLTDMPDDVFRTVISSPYCKNYRKAFLGILGGQKNHQAALAPTVGRFAIYREEAAKEGNEEMVSDVFEWFRSAYRPHGLYEGETPDSEPRLALMNEFVECLLDCTGSASAAGANPFASARGWYADTGYAHALARLANRYFGDSVEMWQTFAAMVDTISEQPLSQLMNGIRILYGEDSFEDPCLPESEEVSEVVIDAVETVSTVSAVQMNLFS